MVETGCQGAPAAGKPLLICEKFCATWGGLAFEAVSFGEFSEGLLLIFIPGPGAIAEHGGRERGPAVWGAK